MIVFVAGMPRAGTMWAYNVVRSIYVAKGFTVLPKHAPTDEKTLIKNAYLSHPQEKEVYCIKTHLALEYPFPAKHQVKIICNIRDVRDACLSYMRFLHADYETGVRVMDGMMRISDYYLTTFKDILLNVRYEDLTSSPIKVIENISNFLGIDLSESEKEEISRKFDKANVQKKLRELSDIKFDANGKIISAEQKLAFETVPNFDGTFRVYDKNTAFQSNHITSNQDGEWRTYFDQEKSDQLISLSKEWLLKHGYEI